MGKTPNYQKWQFIFSDYKNGMKWDDLVKKYKTSKGTISKAIKFYGNLEKQKKEKSENEDLKPAIAYNEIQELNEKIEENDSNKSLLSKKLSNTNKNREYSFKKHRQTIMTIESLKNLTRMRLVILIVVNNELSLGSLSKKVGLSKSTVLRHLKALEKINIISIRREKVRGPKLKQYYSVNPDLTDMIRLTHSMLRKISPEKALDALITDLQTDSVFFSIIKQVIDDVIFHNTKLQLDLKTYRPMNYKTIEKIFSTENHYRYSFWFLNKTQYEKFRIRYREFLTGFLKDLELTSKEDKENKAEETPYFIWHILIPIKKFYDKNL